MGPENVPVPVRKEDEVRKNETVTSVEDLKRKRAELEARVAAAKQAKEEDIARKLNEREQLVAEDNRLVPLIEETQGTLEYFETQVEEGVLVDAASKAELEDLQKLFASLKKQRADGAERYDALMKEPDVYGRIWDEAHNENNEKMAQGEAERKKAEFEAKCAEATKELDAKADAFIARFAEFQKDFVKCYTDLNKKVGAEREVAFENLRTIVGKAQEGLGASQYKTYSALKFEWSDINTYIESLEEYRKKLGLFQGREKAAVDYVVKINRDEFEKAAKVDERYQALVEKYNEMRGAGLDELGREYREIIDDATKKDKELLGSNNSFEHTLRSKLYTLNAKDTYFVYSSMVERAYQKTS